MSSILPLCLALASAPPAFAQVKRVSLEPSLAAQSSSGLSTQRPTLGSWAGSPLDGSLLAPSLAMPAVPTPSPGLIAGSLQLEAPVSARPLILGAPARSAPTLPDALPRLIESNLAIPKNHPAMARYLGLLAQLRKSWERPPFSEEELRETQFEAAAAAGLALEARQNLVEISPRGGHWLNRWTGGLRRSKGVLLLWSPLHNHYDGHGASYDERGWIYSDNLGPLLVRPSLELQHEFLHAYVDRGIYAREFAPLNSHFYGWGWGYPKSEGRKNAGYQRSSSFKADELLTNIHTAYDRAHRLANLYGTGKEGWTSSSFGKAPAEVQHLIITLDTPIFLAESIREMATQLHPGVEAAARLGLRDRTFRKDFGPVNGSIPYAGEVEQNQKNDHGFYTAMLNASPPVEVRYFTLAMLRDDDPKNKALFPVFFLRQGWGLRADLSLPAAENLDLNDPGVQKEITLAAAATAAKKLVALKRLTEELEPAIETLKSLQAEGRRSIDIALLRRIEKTSLSAFQQIVSFFAGPSAEMRGRRP